LRMWGRSWTASVFGALIGFWVNSITLASSGHAFKMEVLTLSILTLCLVEKSIRAGSHRTTLGYAMLTGVVVGIMMIEQQDVALLAGLFIGPYSVLRLIQRRWKEFGYWAALLIPVVVVGLMVSARTLARSYSANIAQASPMQGDPQEKWNFITQWSMVPGEWPDLVALGWSGWRTGDSEAPYWGSVGRSPEWEETGKGFRNFRLDSVYFGIIPFMFGVFGLAVAARNRKGEERTTILFWSVAGIIGLSLAFGKYSLLYKLFFQLPLVNNIRGPIKLLDNFQVCLGIVSAYGLDSLLSNGRRVISAKIMWIVSSVVGGLMVLAGLRFLVSPTDGIERFKNMGFAHHAENMVSNMSNAWFHAAALALICAILVFVVWRGWKPAKWAGMAFILVLAIDSLLLTSTYFKAINIAPLKKGNVVINFLKQNQGNNRTFFMDQSGLYNQWLASDGPYHGLNLFNVWQMPRMPVDYKKFLGTVGKNQVRLWELASIKYVAAPAQIQQQLQRNPQLADLFVPVLNYQVPTAQGMRRDVLLEFKGFIPRFALFSHWKRVPYDEQCKLLADPRHKVSTTVLVEPESRVPDPAAGAQKPFKPVAAEVTRRNAVIEVDVEYPSILRFSQYFNDNWKAYIDGQPVDILRLDYLCMGIQLPAGKHTVEFRCDFGLPNLLFLIGVLAVSILVATVLLLPPKPKATP